LKVTTPPSDKLLLTGFSGHEGISQVEVAVAVEVA
jgi:hypothetical protein